MEVEWAKLTDRERAEFAVWRQQKQEALEAELKAKAEAANKPKLYADMSADEKRAWLRKTGAAHPSTVTRP